jgi:DNA polymerase III delta subunit
MIYFFYGTDRAKIQKTARATFDALQKKKPDASFVQFDGDYLTLSDLEMIAGSQGLFEKKIVAKLSDVLENKDIADDVLKMLAKMKESENIIVWSEGEVNKAPLEKIKKNAEKAEEFLAKEIFKQKEFSIFFMADALGERDKKKLWMLFVEAMKRGKVLEEIHGTLFWQLKTILLAKKTKTAGEAGINPFPYGKAKSFAKNWEENDLLKAISSLVDMYHKAHRGELDFEIAMEKFALGI